MKKKFALFKLMIAVMAAAVLCACEKQPAAVEETPAEVVEETTVVEPAPEVTEPEVTESEEAVEETPEEEIEMPSIVIYDENGDYYQPQSVTLDEMYARIDYANGKYDWKSKWDRDRFVGLLLYENAYYMKDEDIQTLYYDYLDNFGINQIDIDHDEVFLCPEDDYRTKIDLEDLFIDPVLADEAKKYDNAFCSEKVGLDILKDYSKDIINGLDYSQEKLYNIVFEEEILSYYNFTLNDECSREFNEYSHIIMDVKLKVWGQIDLDEEMVDLSKVNSDTYKSSHVE